MATNTSLAAGEIAAHAITLTASSGSNNVDKVTFTDDVNRVEIISDGAADLYVRVDGVDPIVGGAKAYRLPFGVVSSREIPMPSAWDQATGQTVRLISAGATKYSVVKVA